MAALRDGELGGFLTDSRRNVPLDVRDRLEFQLGGLEGDLVSRSAARLTPLEGRHDGEVAKGGLPLHGEVLALACGAKRLHLALLLRVRRDWRVSRPLHGLTDLLDEARVLRIVRAEFVDFLVAGHADRLVLDRALRLLDLDGGEAALLALAAEDRAVGGLNMTVIFQLHDLVDSGQVTHDPLAAAQFRHLSCPPKA